MEDLQMKRTMTAFFVLTFACGIYRWKALASDLTLPVGGKVTIEFIFSDASFSNTLSIVSPTVGIATTGCKVVPVAPLPGVHLSSAKASQRGCRIELDADPATPGIQPFAAGTTIQFRLCADNDGDGTCNNVLAKHPALNFDRNE